jgi:hypothetical protein
MEYVATSYASAHVPATLGAPWATAGSKAAKKIAAKINMRFMGSLSFGREVNSSREEYTRHAGCHKQKAISGQNTEMAFEVLKQFRSGS